ncbi:MAG: DsrE family protein [Chloroflexi bacterium]|nr:DsrE family protein [Chloroflexota bacterium]
MATITVIVGDPPYGKERVYSTLRFVLAALQQGHQVNLFLFEDAVFTPKKGQSPHEFPAVLDQRMPDCEALLEAAIRRGARVSLCGVCASERGMGPNDLSAGEIGGMPQLVQWVLESDRVVCF